MVTTPQQIQGGKAEKPLQSTGRDTHSSYEQLMQYIWPGLIGAQVIYTLARLNVADLIGDGPKTAEELAATTQTHPAALRRLLHAAVALELLTEDAPGSFTLTPTGDTLRSNHPQSIRAHVMLLPAHFIWRPLGELEDAVRTGQPAFERIYGARFFDYMANHPDDAGIFNLAMTAGTAMMIPAIVGAYDFSRFGTLMDVGGGQGTLLDAILNANPNAHGILFDLPNVVRTAVFQDDRVRQRCKIVGGDFFESVPEGADAYILRGVIHDWNDQDAFKILRNCRQAVKGAGILLIIDGVENSGNSHAAGLMDMLMLVLTGGRERTRAEFQALLSQAGFRMGRVTSAGGPSIIEGIPA